MGRWRARRVELTGECQAFRGTLAAKVIICKPADPEAKGLVERLHDYLERSFLPGRSFASPAISTPSSAGSWRGPTTAASGAWAALRSIGSTRTGGDADVAAGAAGDRLAAARCGCRGTTTCGWTATTTRCTRRDRPPDRGLAPTWTGSGCAARGGWSPTMSGCGPSTKPSPTRPIWPPPSCCAASRFDRGARHPPKPRWRQRRLADYDTALGMADADGRWRDGHGAKRPQLAGTWQPRWRS